jgi:hypothetical protein
LGLLLNHLAELLELSIVPKEVEVSKSLLLATSGRTTWVASASGATLLCGSKIEKIDISVVTSIASYSASDRLSWCSLASRDSSGSLGWRLLLLLDVLGDALQRWSQRWSAACHHPKCVSANSRFLPKEDTRQRDRDCSMLHAWLPRPETARNPLPSSAESPQFARRRQLGQRDR